MTVKELRDTLSLYTDDMEVLTKWTKGRRRVMIKLDDAIKEMEKINAGYYQIEFNYKNHRVAITIERIEDEDEDENA